VDHAFVRTDPAQLVVARHASPEARRVLANPVELEPFDQRRERLDRSAAELVAAADREGQAVTGESGAVGVENAVGDGIIRSGVHCIGAVELARCRKADVERPELGDLDHSGKLPRSPLRRMFDIWFP